MKNFALILFSFATLCSCNRKYYSLEKKYRSSFEMGECKNADVFISPVFQTFGFDTNEIRNVKIMFYENNCLFNIITDSTIFFVGTQDLISEPYIYNLNYSVYHGFTSLEERQEYILSQVNKNFSCKCKLFSSDHDFIVTLNGKQVYKISNIVIKERYIDEKKEESCCSIYSYKVNGRKVYYHDFILINPAKTKYYDNTCKVARKKILIDKKYNEESTQFNIMINSKIDHN